jgi:hypothetical protein
LVLVHHPQVSLVDEGGGVERGIGLLAEALPVSHSPQLVVQQGEQTVEGLTAAAA